MGSRAILDAVVRSSTYEAPHYLVFSVNMSSFNNVLAVLTYLMGAVSRGSPFCMGVAIFLCKLRVLTPSA
jgi:hypothetical protein